MFQVGDQVQWMKVTQRGRSTSFSQRYGEIKLIEHGRAVIYDYHSRRKESIKLANLLPQGKPGQVDQVFHAIANQNRKPQCEHDWRHKIDSKTGYWECQKCGLAQATL